MTPISAYIITKNEERDLPGCLDSLKGLADELVVVDDESSDRTVALAKERGAKVFSRKMMGYGSQKQFALDQCLGEWVLSIDADERVSPDLAEALRQAARPSRGLDGYYLKRHLYFLGQRLRFGGVGHDWVLRFFRRNQGRYEPREVHERVVVSGKTGRLRGHLDHFSYASLDDYLQKIPVYTALAARQRWKEGKRFSFWQHLRPGWELLNRIVLHGAWLDGHAGLTYAALSAHAAWLRSIKLKEMEKGGA